jgi:hypothetical protein
MPAILTSGSTPGTKAASAGLHQHQRGLKVLDFGDNPHGHAQSVE